MNLDKESSQPSFSKSWAERNGFSDWSLAILWIIIAFIGFQFTAAIVALVLLLVNKEGQLNAAEVTQSLTENLDLLFIGNTSGQILFLGLATWFFVRLHTSKSKRPQFLRFSSHSSTPSMLGLTFILILAIQPTIWFLGWLNAFLPVPDMLSDFQSSQMQMIENFLRGDHLLVLTLFHVGVVPAICEEVLYRGYVMRAFEKSWGILPAILISGLLFGLYHVQLSNLLPLASIGIVLGFVTWASESIYPAMLAHFVNNGGSVLVGSYYPDTAFAEMTPETMPPFWAVAVSIIISGYLIYYMYQQHKNLATERTNDV
ncbi:MAG: CPBP family glutamic-type intramembrane protease [Candidatus Halalkalibacterium sp. M3_1C_030]